MAGPAGSNSAYRRAAPRPLVAVDIGNTRLKAGLFRTLSSEPLSSPDEVWRLSSHAAASPDWRKLAESLPREQCHWRVASVCREGSAALRDWLASERASDSVQWLDSTQMPLQILVDAPSKVGIDRLVGAVAANRLRPNDRAAIVIDLGSAFTVDLVSKDGAFCGGAIMPGLAMMGQALYDKTDALPHVDADTADIPPPVLGKNTIAAIRSGLYWGSLGALKETIARLGASQSPTPQVFITGGVAPEFAGQLDASVVHVPELILSGIAAIE